MRVSAFFFASFLKGTTFYRILQNRYYYFFLPTVFRVKNVSKLQWNRNSRMYSLLIYTPKIYWWGEVFVWARGFLRRLATFSSQLTTECDVIIFCNRVIRWTVAHSGYHRGRHSRPKYYAEIINSKQHKCCTITY